MVVGMKLRRGRRSTGLWKRVRLNPYLSWEPPKIVAREVWGKNPFPQQEEEEEEVEPAIHSTALGRSGDMIDDLSPFQTLNEEGLGSSSSHRELVENPHLDDSSLGYSTGEGTGLGADFAEGNSALEAGNHGKEGFGVNDPKLKLGQQPDGPSEFEETFAFSDVDIPEGEEEQKVLIDSLINKYIVEDETDDSPKEKVAEN